MKPSAGFMALVGDYAALPRVYRPEDYAWDVAGLNVAGSVWAEFISCDPLSEVRWAAALTRDLGRPSSLIALVDFADPALDRLLDAYMASGPSAASASTWGGIRRSRCSVTRRNPTCCRTRRGGVGWPLCAVAAWRAKSRSSGPSSTISERGCGVPGYPIRAARDGLAHRSHRRWPFRLEAGLALVAACPNVTLKIFGLECIFGVRWTTAQVRPWILNAIEVFSPDRCMFASHMPICKLACSFGQLYATYFEIIAEFTPAEKRRMVHDNAAALYGISQP